MSPVAHKTLFQLFAESILAMSRRYGCPIPWYIMTSDATDDETRDFFSRNNRFGLEPDQIHFFKQGAMPAVDSQGRILLAQRHRVALAPDGHGGSFAALRNSGALARMLDQAIETISYFQVDNPLVSPIDPLFVGLHALSGSQMSSIAVPKAHDFERVGIFAIVDGRLTVIEYSDLPEALAKARSPDGSRRLDAGNIAVHMLATEFVDRLTRQDAPAKLPWHRAHKRVANLDPATDQWIEPDQPNGFKFERFIFDALPLAKDPMIWKRDRSDCFSPVKNAHGDDSPDTARRDMIARAARWLEHYGVSIPRRQDGQVDAAIEISPLRAADAAHLAESINPGLLVNPGQPLFLE